MVRVVIQRHLKENKKGDLLPLLRALRTAAMSYSGYIHGESLVSTEDPSIISVLSTWQSMEEWKKWENSEQRVKLYEQIESLLVEKPKVSVYLIMATEEK
jgi:antibiotic biosynthesis monooxygenase (ABM) superfamily enzyme